MGGLGEMGLSNALTDISFNDRPHSLPEFSDRIGVESNNCRVIAKRFVENILDESADARFHFIFLGGENKLAWLAEFLLVFLPHQPEEFPLIRLDH